MAARVYAIASDGPLMPGGMTGAKRVSLPGVIKTNDLGEHFVANEYVANCLGRFLGVQIPPGSLHKFENGIGFACLNFKMTEETLPPLDGPECFRKLPDESTGLLMFDILIANPDRHSSNAWAVLRDTPYDLIAFDHGHALLGHDKAKCLQRLKELKDRLGISGGSVTRQNRHCLIDHVTNTDHFGKWMNRIATIPNHYIETVCDDVRDLGLMDFAECGELKTFLKHRRDNFKAIVDSNQNEFKGISQWGLL